MIDNLFNLVLPSIEHFHLIGYWLAFFAALLETTLLIGMILPGSTFLLVLGAYSAGPHLDFGDLLWFAIVGAVLGDNLNYWLGKKYGKQWVKTGIWFIKPAHFDRTREFFDNHGAKSVFLGRFIPSVKEFIPFIAGTVGMKRKTFILWNVLGAIGWGTGWLGIGYLFAQSLNLAELWLSRAGIFIGFLVIIGIVLYFLKWLISRKGKQLLTVIVSILKSIKEALLKNEYIAPWFQKHPRTISFLKARFDTAEFSGMTLSIFVLTFFYVVALFAGIIEDLITSDPIVAVDVHVANLVAVLRTESLIEIFSWITLLGKSQVVLVFITLTIIFLWLWRKSNYIYALVIAVSGSELFTYLGKLAFHRARPELSVYTEHSFSFPSGHATIAISFYGFIGYLLIRFSQSWNKKVNLFFITVFVILAIGLSRIYLGAHYISDVWSGYLVGTMWLIIAIYFSEWLEQKKHTQSTTPVSGARLLSYFIIFLAILFYSVFSINYQPLQSTIPSNNKVVVLKSTDIFTREELKYNETLLGKKKEPISFIFIAKDDSKVITALQNAGWSKADNSNFLSFVDAVKSLISKIPHPSAPVSPSFWNTKTQDLSFAKVTGKNWLSSAHHLKIWRTNYQLKNGKNIYVAITNATDGLKWGIIPVISPDLVAERELLYQDLNHTGLIENHNKVQLVKPLIGNNFVGDPFFTDGKAYIVTVQ